MGKTTEISTYCRKCFYDLRGIGSKSRCPECGKSFDLSDPKTFRTRPPRSIWRKLRWVVYPLLLVVLAGIAGITWLWWGWRHEQPAVAWAQGNPTTFATFNVIEKSVAPPWLQKGSGRWRYLLERVDQLAARGSQRVTPADFPLSRLRRLTRLTLEGPGIGDGLMGEVGRLRELTWVELESTAITDGGLARLRGCRRIGALSLTGSAVGDNGLAPLAEHPELTMLRLNGTRVDDRAVPVLKALTKLEYLSLHGTKVTPEGVAELKKALPGCQLDGP